MSIGSAAKGRHARSPAVADADRQRAGAFLLDPHVGCGDDRAETDPCRLHNAFAERDVNGGKTPCYEGKRSHSRNRE